MGSIRSNSTNGSCSDIDGSLNISRSTNNGSSCIGSGNTNSPHRQEQQQVEVVAAASALAATVAAVLEAVASATAGTVATVVAAVARTVGRCPVISGCRNSSYCYSRDKGSNGKQYQQ